jgi:hypothetical protein
MPDTYDPLTSEFLVDATIGAVTYIVTAFTDSGAAVVERNFTNSNGSWRGRSAVKGENTASMTIECTNAAQAEPDQFATFTYKGSTWVIKNVSKAVSSTAPSSWTLALGWVS